MSKELTIENTSLPFGWEIVKLDKICDLQNGFAFKSKDYISHSKTMNFRMSQIRPGGTIDLEKNPKFLPDDYCIKYKDYLLQEGDVVIAMTDLATETKILGVPTILPKDDRKWLQNQRVGKFSKIDFSKIDLEFLKYVLTSNDVNEFYKNLGKGGLQINLRKQDILNVQIPLPPLAQQKQIVAILDISFAAIDTAKANAEQNLQNAKELFESTKKNVFDNLEGISNKVELPYVCDNIFAGGDVPKGHYSKTITDEYQIPIIANAVKDNGLYGFTNKVRVSKASITIAARGSGTGHTEIRTKPFFPIVRLIVLTPNSELIKLEFLKYSIQNLDILRSGSAIPQLTVPMIKGYLILLPKLEEQVQIVRKLNSLSIETKKLEAIYKQKIADLEEMKKSVLQKAFSGQLNTIN